MLIAVTMTALSVVAVPQACRADAIDEYNLALQLYKQERWQRAATQLEQFLKDAPGHEKAPLAQLYLGQSLVHLREFARARPVFRDFVRAQPGHSDVALAMYRIGECSYFLDDYPTARKELRDFLSQVPPDHDLAEWGLQYLGETELRLGNMQDAANAFERLLTQFKNGRLGEEARFGLARAYEGLDRKNDAISLYRQLAANPQGARAADAQFNLAARLFEDQKYAAAADEFEAVARAFSQHNLSPLSRLNAGFSRYHLGEYPAAIASFKQVSDDDKLGRTARYWIGLSDKSLGEHERAGEELLALLREDERQPLAENILFHAADCKRGMKSYPEATRMFLEVADRFPQGELADDALHSATECALLAGDFPEAEKIHRRFSEQFPASGLQLPAELLYGRLLLARGDQLSRDKDAAKREQAKQAYRQAADTFLKVLESSTIPQTQTLARLQLARAWDRLENYDRLIETLQPLADGALAEDATDEQLGALFMQSSGWLALKDYDRAREAAQQYLERRPQGDDAAEAWANIAVAQSHLGDWESSMNAVEQVRTLGDPALANPIAYEVAQVAYDEGHWETARSLYESVVKQQPADKFYVPSLSGLAFSLYEQGREALLASEEVTADGKPIDGTAKLSEAMSRFEESARRFGKLAQLAGQTQDRKVQSNAAYMQGLSLKLARRLQPAVDVLLPAVEQFSLPADVSDPSPLQLDIAYNAYRSAKEAARTFVELGQLDKADTTYQTAFAVLERQPAERRQELDLLLNEWALMHYNAERFERSDELFRLLIAESPQSEWADDALLLLGESDYFADRFEQAREKFRQLVRDPATDEFVRQRASLLLIDTAAALEDWESVIEAAKSLSKLLSQQTPESIDRWYAEYRLGEAALRQGDLPAAAAALKPLIDKYAGTEVGKAEWFPNVWLKLAETQLRSKDYAAVEQTVSRFKQQHEDSPLTYQFDDILGLRFANEGRFEEAREAFERVVQSRDGRGTATAAKAQFYIAESWLKQANAAKGQPEQARQLFEQAFLAYSSVLLYDFPEWQAPALWMAGQCDEALQHWADAKKSYQQLIADFPEDKYAAQAQERLDDLERRFPTSFTP